MAQTMLVGDEMTLKVEGRNDQGQTARLPPGQLPRWEMAPPGVVQLRSAGDGLLVTVSATAPGDVTLTITVGELPPFTYEISVLPSAATLLMVHRV